MPPDADKLRQRKAAVTAAGITTLPQPPQLQLLKRSVHELNSTEVCIDGVVYDITSFDHPGGDQIHVFGGNDVTVQYKMIHPFHTSYHLSKMKIVGRAVDCQYDYQFDTEFEREMKREVFNIVRRGREYGTPGWFFRCFVYLAVFAYLQYCWATGPTTFALAIMFGLSQSAIGMNVQHDANHGACSKHAWINDMLGFGADLIGGCKWLWQEQHWTHHSFTNHRDMDPDAFGAEPLLLFNNYPDGHPARWWIHNFQIVLFLPVLSGYWISSIFNPQVLDLRQRGAETIGLRMESAHIKSRRKFAWLLRLSYIWLNVICPFRNNDNAWTTVLAHILIMSVAESLGLAVLFSLSHNFENADRDPTAEVRRSGEPVCWFKSQVETSSSYGGVVAGWLTGGLNFQIEHHLFPRMSSAWYPYIAPTVRRVCEKHGVRYVYYPWVHQNLISTMKYLHCAGTGASWLENPYSGKL